MNLKDYFRKKKITVMGLGLLGRGVGDVKFLAEDGADLIVTDLKSEKELAPSLQALSGYKNIKFILGGHRMEDFCGRDMIIKAAGVPLDSSFIDEARKNGIPIKMSVALFAKLTQAMVVGVTGTRGKTTVTELIYRAIKMAGKKVYLGGNIQGVATLPLLEKTELGDIAVLELDSWILQGFGEEKISPHIAVFTTFLPDHLNYYKKNQKLYLADKANIFLFQNKKDFLALGPQAVPIVGAKYENQIKSTVVIADPKKIPLDWKIKILGEHNRDNISVAIEVLNILGVTESIIKKAVEEFKAVPGRLELISDKRGIKIYNDTTATTPDATIAGLKALGKGKNIILIMGGTDKNLGIGGLIKTIPKYCKAVILLPGTGTEKLRSKKQEARNKNENILHTSYSILQKTPVCNDLIEALTKAIEVAKPGDVVLFSPAFASFGMFKNEYDRGEKFLEAVKNLVY